MALHCQTLNRENKETKNYEKKVFERKDSLHNHKGSRQKK